MKTIVGALLAALAVPPHTSQRPLALTAVERARRFEEIVGAK